MNDSSCQKRIEWNDHENLKDITNVPNFLKNKYFADASGPSTVNNAALDANDITSRAVLTRFDNAGDHSRFGGHHNSNTDGTSSSSAFIYTENTEENNRTITDDVRGNVSPTGGDDGTDMTHGINRPEGTSRVPIVTDSVDEDNDLFGAQRSGAIQIDADNDDDVEITRVLNAIRVDAGLFP